MVDKLYFNSLHVIYILLIFIPVGRLPILLGTGNYNFCISRGSSGRAEFKVQTMAASHTYYMDSNLNSIFEPIGMSFPKQAMTVAAFILNFSAPQIQLLLQKMPLASFLGKDFLGKLRDGEKQKLRMTI